MERQVPGVQAPQEARPPRLGYCLLLLLLLVAPPQGQRRRGRLRAPARSRGRPVQRLLPGAGGGLRHTAQGTSPPCAGPRSPVLPPPSIRVVTGDNATVHWCDVRLGVLIVVCAGAEGGGRGRAAAAVVGSGDEECAQGDRGPARGDGTAAQLQRHQLHRFASQWCPSLFL